jgi:hypothetical protein
MIGRMTGPEAEMIWREQPGVWFELMGRVGTPRRPAETSTNRKADYDETNVWLAGDGVVGSDGDPRLGG